MPHHRKSYSLAVYFKELQELDKNKLKIAKVTQESVESTKRMLRLVDECQDAGVNTLRLLHAQGESLNRTEQTLDHISNDLHHADEGLKRIEFMEKVPCILLPFYFFFKTKRSSQPKSLPPVVKEVEPLALDLPQEVQNSQKFPEQVNRRRSTLDPLYTNLNLHNENSVTVLRERFFPKITGGKEEVEIERHLEHVSSRVGGLKEHASQFSNTLINQNSQLGRMHDKAESNHDKVKDVTERTKKLVDDDSDTSIDNSCFGLCSIT